MTVLLRYKRHICTPFDKMRNAKYRKIIPVLTLAKLFDCSNVDAQSSTALINTTTTPSPDLWDPYGGFFRAMVVVGAAGAILLLVWVIMLTICFVRYEMFTQKQIPSSTQNPVQARYSFIKNNVPPFAEHIRI